MSKVINSPTTCEQPITETQQLNTMGRDALNFAVTFQQLIRTSMSELEGNFAGKSLHHRVAKQLHVEYLVVHAETGHIFLFRVSLIFSPSIIVLSCFHYSCAHNDLTAARDTARLWGWVRTNTLQNNPKINAKDPLKSMDILH